MLFRRFNQYGMDAFRLELDSLRADPQHAFTKSIVDDPRLTEQLEPAIEATPTRFATRMDFAHWLHDVASKSEAEIPRNDAGFWTWLTAALFDQVCPADQKGARKIGEDARYIPQYSLGRKYYRHLLANPFDVYQIHADDPSRAAVVMTNPLDKPGELTAQFSGRRDLLICPGSMAVATRLFVDSVTGKRKHGASGKAAARLGKMLNQFNRTWDLSTVKTDEFMARLPKEFDRFKPKSG